MKVRDSRFAIPLTRRERPGNLRGMQIGILSDIHDRRDNLRTVLLSLEECDAILCLGDLCSPFIVSDLAKGFPRDIHIVFGNNDGDLMRITRNAEAACTDERQVLFHGEFAEIVFEGKRFALIHYDTIGRALARSDLYDVVCCGHNHEHEVTQVGETLLINPGEVHGLVKGVVSCGVYDTETGDADILIF